MENPAELHDTPDDIDFEPFSHLSSLSQRLNLTVSHYPML